MNVVIQISLPGPAASATQAQCILYGYECHAQGRTFDSAISKGVHFQEFPTQNCCELLYSYHLEIDQISQAFVN